MVFSQIQQYRELHATMVYGATSAGLAPYLIPHIKLLKAKSIIDYGCGQSALPDRIKAAGFPTVHRYDPAIPAYADRPNRTFDLLISVDVLEHIPESEIDDVLADMRSLAPHAMLIIDTKPAVQILPNGENAHATVKPPEWWRERLRAHYEYLEPFHSGRGLRARFKTWPTSPIDVPLIWMHSVTLKTLHKIRRSRKHVPWLRTS